MSSVRVAVRVRPMSKREKQLSSKMIVHMKGNTTSVHKPSSVRGDKLKDRGKIFTYDFSYDSTDRESSTFASQEKIFQDLGTDVLNAAFEGFNSCVFAYGQTGSGKSYTMMGYKMDKGLIPQICEGLFSEISNRCKSGIVSFRTEVSYLEIYNERVQDLLKKKSPCAEGAGLKVREHPTDGPYVENLSKHVVHGHGDIEGLISLGNANRAIASTGMNDFSSRSHAIFTVMLTQAWFDAELPRERLSKIHLVDLAGSERADATCTTGTRLKEGANINKSLVTLGSVISALADLNGGEQSTKKMFIPYRDSVLTWLLKDSLGGNSITTMIATISPAGTNYMETLNTLRYATRAKNIMNTPRVNEDGSVKMIRELQAEVTRLQTLLAEATQVESVTEQWNSKWDQTQNILQEETVALRKEGSGVVLDCLLPHLIGIDEDLLRAGINLYYLKEGRTLIGSDDALCSQDIVLHGPGLLREHCVLENCAGTVTLFPQDGALCSVNGSVVTEHCQLTQGAVIQLGGGTTLRFNCPAEGFQLRDKQRELPSAFSKSTEDPSTVMQQNSGHFIQMEALEESESKDPKVCLKSTSTVKLMTTAIPERDPVPHNSLESDGDALQGGVSIRDGQEQERDLCHKSGPELMSERPQRRAQSGAAVASYNGEEVWSGDASLQQTSVLGPGDGCGMKPEGNANEIQGVVTDCYKGSPGSGGSSLESLSHLQRNRGSGFASVLPETGTHSQLNRKPLNTQTARCPTKDAASEEQRCCKEMNESGRLEDIPEVGLTQIEAPAVQKSKLGSLLSRVSWLVQDVPNLLRSSPTILHQVANVKLLSIGACWSRHVVSLVKDSNVLSVAKGSQAFSVVRGSFVSSLLGDFHIFSVVKELPLIQHIQMNISQHFQPKEAAWMIQGCINPDNTLLPALTSAQTMAEELRDDKRHVSEDFCEKDLPSPQKRDWVAKKHVEQDGKITEPLLLKQINKTEIIQIHENKDQALENSKTVDIAIQTLIEYPEPLLALQNLPLRDIMDTLQTIISTSAFSSQQGLSLYWLNVATYSKPEPQPGLLILMGSDLYTLTADSGLLVLFHRLPLLQLEEIQIGLAGQSLRLMGATEESLLGVYTHSQQITKELCWAILDVVCPGDRRMSLKAVLHKDLMKLLLDCQLCVPDLLLDAGLSLCCRFQKSFVDLVYLIHCNMNQAAVTLGEVQLLLYTSVAVQISPAARGERVAQFFLTDTHFGLVKEDVVFHPAPHFVTAAACHPHFHDLAVRRCSDVRCILVLDEDGSGSVRLDVILANERARGHPESVVVAATPSEHALNSPPHAEVWKLTFSCSAEATCLINHLSNV
ncbi:uncharacterized protein kif16bb [Kryptolebias marmoratus]|uniref:uncharacterized protein kif16bb n=1 Tax=Kryptolebias marmoratus TaxID=37003 RepID=UPI0007F8793A|nr:uncharacterized protein kif16bb [Kryptolebias marmoratus]